ncbi:LPS export ABC transporter periplasmic protein LptC, partial [Candidatus Pelagibacter sp.]|nr:LPS export ABC transporter periplasmic protein LptC [Candidatus Pelagibacter sp.]
MKKKITIMAILILVLSITIIFFFKNEVDRKNNQIIKKQDLEKEIKPNSNIIKDIEYRSKDVDGHEYILTAKKGEFDIEKSNIIFLTELYAKISLSDSNIIEISSDFGKYNNENYDTLFSKNVSINYMENEITA